MQIKNIHFETIDSTNTWAKVHVNDFEKKSLTVISADTQTAGRGRFSRVWVSPKGGIYVTYVFFVDTLDQNLGNFPQILALAAFKVLINYIPKVNLKWPNDIVVKGKKIGGILCEIVENTIILGIGINIDMSEQDLKKIDKPATSLYDELKTFTSLKEERENIFHALTNQFLNNFKEFKKKGFDPFYVLYKEALVHKKGDLLLFSDFFKTIPCTFQSFNEDGSITCRLADGKERRFFTGELL